MPRAKKDINKELMFQKIMPSADDSDLRANGQQPDDSLAAEEIQSNAAQPEAAQPEAAQPEAARLEAPQPEPSTLSVPQILHAQPSGVAEKIVEKTLTFSSETGGVLVNLMEKATADNLENVLSRFKCCKCDRCRKDMLACALNTITPKYVVIEGGMPASAVISPQLMTEITTALVRAVIKVKSSPRHG